MNKELYNQPLIVDDGKFLNIRCAAYSYIQEHIHVSVNVKCVICRYVVSCMKMYADAETHSTAQLRWKGNFSPNRICHNTPPFVVGGLSQGPRRGPPSEPHLYPIGTPTVPCVAGISVNGAVVTGDRQGHGGCSLQVQLHRVSR